MDLHGAVFGGWAGAEEASASSTNRQLVMESAHAEILQPGLASSPISGDDQQAWKEQKDTGVEAHNPLLTLVRI